MNFSISFLWLLAFGRHDPDGRKPPTLPLVSASSTTEGLKAQPQRPSLRAFPEGGATHSSPFVSKCGWPRSLDLIRSLKLLALSCPLCGVGTLAYHGSWCFGRRRQCVGNAGRILEMLAVVKLLHSESVDVPVM